MKDVGGWCRGVRVMGGGELWEEGMKGGGGGIVFWRCLEGIRKGRKYFEGDG